MGLRKIINMFRDGNVCVTGLRGRGKDMLIANVVVRRKLPYISNVDYGGEYHPLNLDKLDCGKNTYKQFISGCVNYYKYPYSDQTDVYISDVGIYFPSQFCNELNKQYPYMPVFQALTRQLGSCNFHINVQNLNRAWDKIREQSDCYIMCLRCIVIFGMVFQVVRIYDKYESCVNRVKPFSVSVPLIGSGNTRYQVRLQRASYEANYGMIKNMILIYKNKSNYNTRFFKDMLENGRKEDNSNEKYQVQEVPDNRLDSILDSVESFFTRKRRS